MWALICSGSREGVATVNNCPAPELIPSPSPGPPSCQVDCSTAREKVFFAKIHLARLNVSRQRNSPSRISTSCHPLLSISQCSPPPPPFAFLPPPPLEQVL
ncbi:hypothetical protein CEXT_569531 [Caerostris extrusa]|uniref:Uncharacterized protein n=1 Tax=Caerostris extrusa TaxID=172846 RepID=A0AAV4RHZ3_CAEEX|nr:hypothetical protein CEXT_569531 [Caerostris extrusa]